MGSAPPGVGGREASWTGAMGPLMGSLRLQHSALAGRVKFFLIPLKENTVTNNVDTSVSSGTEPKNCFINRVLGKQDSTSHLSWRCSFPSWSCKLALLPREAASELCSTVLTGLRVNS